MASKEATATSGVTTDYTKFKLMTANRDISRQYINSMKEAFKAHPDILKVQPILINENWFIIDGQHRLTAAAELGIPIGYSMVPGIGIEVARAMNVLQRPWQPKDFAKSYAMGGKKDYQEYLRCINHYQMHHSTVMAFLAGRRFHGMNVKFRKGEFEIEDLERGREWLDQVLEVKEIVAPFNVSVPFTYALLHCFKQDEFDYKRFMTKLEKHHSMVLQRSTSVDDYLRMVEEIYNYNMGDKGKARLF